MKNNFPHFRHSFLLLLATALLPFTACSEYDDEPELCRLTVALSYSDSLMQPYEGARVEARSRTMGGFVDSTDASGTATFYVTPGVYEITSSGQQRITGWRLFANGTKSNVVVQPDSTNHVDLLLTVTRRRTSN